MKILGLDPHAFLTWKGARLEPSPGLTLITGVNGSGKTALGLELPAWLLWGETVRGTSPKGAAKGEFAGPEGWTYEVRRKWARGGKDNFVQLWQTSSAAGDGAHDLSGQTATETQERINRVFGSWRRFASTRVFSRRLLNRFGGATNKERVGLMEEVLGLDRFERSYRWVREERGRRADRASAAAADLTTAERVLEQAHLALRSLEASPGASVESVTAKMEANAKEWNKAKQRADDLLPYVEKAQAALRAAEDKVTSSRATADALGKQLHKLWSRQSAGERPKECPTCRRPFDQASAAQADDHLAGEIAEARRRHEEGAAAEKEAANDVPLLRAKHAQVSARWQAEAQAVAVAVQENGRLTEALSAAATREGQLAALRGQVEDADGTAVYCQAADTMAKTNLQVADMACAVLGPKGARAKLLEGSLALLEMEANAVLPRLGGKVEAVRIKGSRAKADGGMVDEVSIEVVGAGGGDYRGVSDGEQVRLDVALLLALARISGDTGYVAFDEVFDALDEAGLAGVGEILEEMARERQVVVMSHNARFQDLLPGAERLRAVPQDDGTSRLEAA